MSFGFGLGLQITSRGEGGGPAGPEITSPGSLNVATFKIGTEHVITAGTAIPTGSGAITYEYRWIADAVTTLAAFTPQAADDGDSIVAQWRAVETGGTNDGETGWQTVGSGTVTYPAPTVVASDAVAGRTITITVDSLTPAGSASLTILTLDGQDVLGQETGSGPWQYVVPDDASSQTVEWQVTATNSGGSDTSIGSEVVAANLFAPSGTLNTNLAGRTVTAWVSAISGTPAPTPILDSFTSGGSDVSGSVIGAGTAGDPWTYVVPSSVSSTGVVVGASLNNGIGSPWSDTDNTISVPADLFAPTVTASDGLAGRTLTISVTGSTGNPAPSLALTTLTLDGGNVLGDSTGTSPWQYVVPDDAAAQTVVWEVTATNAHGSDTAGGSEVVPANLFAPVASAGIADQTFTEDTAITPLNVAADFSGTAPITFALAPTSGALPIGLSLSSAGLLTGTPTELVTNRAIVVRGTNAHGNDDTAFQITVNAAGDTQAPTITAFSAGTQSGGDLPLTVEADEGGTLGWVYTTTNQSGSAKEAVKAAAEGGTPLTDQVAFGTFAAATTGTYPQTLPDGLEVTNGYMIAVMWDAAGNISSVVFDLASVDTDAPTLTSPTAASTGQTTATWGATSDQSGGNLYAGARPSASAALTAAQLIAGSGGAGVAFDTDTTPTADSSNGGTFTGLTAGTEYESDMVHVDAQGNDSAVVSSAAFTTDAAGATTPPPVVGSDTYLTPASIGEDVWTLPAGIQENDIILVHLASDAGPITNGTAGGGTGRGILSSQGYTEIHSHAGNNPALLVAYKVMGSTPDTTITVEQSNTTRMRGIIYVVRDADITTPVDNGVSVNATGNGTVPDAPSHTTITDNALRVIVGAMDDESTNDMTPPVGWENVVTSRGTSISIGTGTLVAATAGALDPPAFDAGGSTDECIAVHYAIRPAS